MIAVQSAGIGMAAQRARRRACRHGPLPSQTANIRPKAPINNIPKAKTLVHSIGR